MKILTVDTSTELCGLALAEDRRLIADYRLNLRNVHNERLVAAIDATMQDVLWQLSDLDVLGVVAGPGSFTGLRIGLSVIKGLAFALEKPVVAVNSLDVLAWGVRYWNGPVRVAIKARENEVYVGKYIAEESGLSEGEYSISAVSELADGLAEPTLIVANPPALLHDFSGGNMIAAPYEVCLPSLACAAMLAFRKAEQANTVQAGDLEPFYLQDFSVRKKKKYVD